VTTLASVPVWPGAAADRLEPAEAPLEWPEAALECPWAVALEWPGAALECPWPVEVEWPAAALECPWPVEVEWPGGAPECPGAVEVKLEWPGAAPECPGLTTTPLPLLSTAAVAPVDAPGAGAAGLGARGLARLGAEVPKVVDELARSGPEPVCRLIARAAGATACPGVRAGVTAEWAAGTAC
jgi:hypothetical protein